MLYILIQYCYYTIVLLLIFKNSLFIFLGMLLRVGQEIKIGIDIFHNLEDLFLPRETVKVEKHFETQVPTSS